VPLIDHEMMMRVMSGGESRLLAIHQQLSAMMALLLMLLQATTPITAIGSTSEQPGNYTFTFQVNIPPRFQWLHNDGYCGGE